MAQLIISQEYLRTKSIIDDGTDFSRLVNVIEDVENLKIKPMLGAKLYKQILFESTPGNTLTVDNKILLDEYVLPCAVRFIMSMSPMVLKYRYANKGIMVNSGDNAQAADDAGISKLTDYWNNIAEQYKNLGQLFIKANLDKYPLYYSNTAIDENKPDQSAFGVDIYLPDYNICCEYCSNGSQYGSGYCTCNRGKYYGRINSDFI